MQGHTIDVYWSFGSDKLSPSVAATKLCFGVDEMAQQGKGGWPGWVPFSGPKVEGGAVLQVVLWPPHTCHHAMACMHPHTYANNKLKWGKRTFFFFIYDYLGAAHNVCWTVLSREVITKEVCLGPICLLLLSTRWRRRKQPEEASLSVRIEGPLWRGEIQELYRRGPTSPTSLISRILLPRRKINFYLV